MVTYDIYHDESTEDAYWHGYLFVPRDERKYLLDLLSKARENTRYFSKITYKNLSKRNSRDAGISRIIHSWTSIGIASLQQQKLNKYPAAIYLGKKPQSFESSEYVTLSRYIKCKFVILKERDLHKKMYFINTDPLRNIEITFKMGIKLGLHGLFDDEQPVTVGNIFIDGDKHYSKYKRNFNKDKIIQDIILEKRSYVSIMKEAAIIPQNSNHKDAKDNQSAEHSHLLQLCDILIGGFRFHSISGDINHVRYKVSQQCKELLDHDQSNAIRMKNSRYCKGFTLNEAWLENDEWNFCNLQTVNKIVDEQPYFDL